jgi:hypothetical protein
MCSKEIGIPAQDSYLIKKRKKFFLHSAGKNFR